MAIVPVPLPSHEMSISFTEAVAMIEQCFGAVTASETVSLSAGRSRFLAADIVAPVAVPPHANSAVDGYARRLRRHGSGMLPSIADSEGLLEIAEDTTEIRPGMVFPFLPFAGFGL